MDARSETVFFTSLVYIENKKKISDLCRLCSRVYRLSSVPLIAAGRGIKLVSLSIRIVVILRFVRCSNQEAREREEVVFVPFEGRRHRSLLSWRGREPFRPCGRVRGGGSILC